MQSRIQFDYLTVEKINLYFLFLLETLKCHADDSSKKINKKKNPK